MDDSAYAGLAEAVDDARWAFGTGFTDPLAGVDTRVPDGVDAGALATYCLALGDDALVLSHRLQEHVTRLPELELEAAVANVALDLLGQARLLLARAGAAEGRGRDEDVLAFSREQHELLNVQAAELPIGDFADLVVRVLVLGTWRLELMSRLRGCADPVLSAVAAKAVPELSYHRDDAAEWVVRLGDGTEESHTRMQAAVDRLWPYVTELTEASPVEVALPDLAVDPTSLREPLDAVLDSVLAEATLARPADVPTARVRGRAGREGLHTGHLGRAMAEWQSVARAHPGASW